MPSINFAPDNKTVEVREDETILQAALRAGIPHTHVCGGKARCTTCRVFVVNANKLEVSLPGESEIFLSRKLGFCGNVRLACQTRVMGDIQARRLVIDDDDVDMALSTVSGQEQAINSSGVEKRVVILFSDIRNFTSFSDKQLPYDVIHMLNRYFRKMRQVIEDNHGQVYNYMGDGLLALFGVEESGSAPENAVRCGLQMLEVMQQMQPYLENTYQQGLDIGIGIHCGDVVIGTIDDSMGDRKMVIGDAVNFASRVESANKTSGTDLLISRSVFEEIGDSLEIGKTCSVEIKGKSGEHSIYEVLSMDKK